MTESQALPDFALDAWRDTQTRAACLALQDEAGADTALALAALFLSARGRTADAATAARLRGIAGDWAATITPLRAARRAMKRRDADLYAQATTLEVAAELRLLALLDEAMGGAPADAPSGEAIPPSLTSGNLAALIGEAAATPAGRRLADRWRAGAPAPIEAEDSAGEAERRMTDQIDQEKALETLYALRAEHRALDAEVAAATATPMADQLKLMRLKRQKLALKDRISRLEDEIRPDIIA